MKKQIDLSELDQATNIIYLAGFQFDRNTMTGEIASEIDYLIRQLLFNVVEPTEADYKQFAVIVGDFRKSIDKDAEGK